MNKKDIFTGLLIAFALAIFLNQDFFFKTLPNQLFGAHRYKSETLKIVLSSEATDLSPYSLNLNNLIRTGNLYQGLVAFDRNLRIIPALAVSWGNLNPSTWEFKLRQEVVFHDGSPLDADSVIASYQDALTMGGSQVASLLATIKEIKKIDDFTVQVITKEPDPLILSKLTKFNISLKGEVGTGPFTVREWVKGTVLSLSAFPDYWGRQPIYRNVDYEVTANKSKRQSDFDKGLTDILVAVPRNQALNLPEDQVRNSYSLEVNFMMFKLDDPILQDIEIRRAIASLFDPSRIEEIGNFFVRPVSQFVAPGVYGFNPAIPIREYNEETAASNLFGAQRKKITLDYLPTYRTLTEYIQRSLLKAGFLVNANAVEPAELLERIKNNDSQLFIVGWQAENGDSGDFLDAFIHSEGEFNNGRYTNEEIDKLIEASRQELDPQKRLKSLQQIMVMIDKDLIGIPLFESSRLYAVKKGVEWEPRLDGLVLASDVK